MLATGTFTGESASGWQRLTFGSPVAVTANTTYVASYFAPNGHYPANSNYFASAGVDNAPLHALADGVDGGNGTYVYGSGNTFPNNTYQSENYWVDVVFTSSTGPDTTPPSVISVSPASGATLVPATAAVNAVFSEPINTATLSGSTFQLLGPGSSAVAASVTYSTGSQTATLTPTAALAFSDDLYRRGDGRKQRDKGRGGQRHDLEFHLVVYHRGCRIGSRNLSLHSVELNHDPQRGG